MSAFDIAGAIVWSPLALFFWTFTVGTKNSENQGVGFWLSVLFTLAAVFCIARLFGARI